MKYYIDIDGNYLGGWDSNPPNGAIEVETAPSDARSKWINSAWSDPIIPYAESRTSEYPSVGDQLDSLFHAGVFPPEMAAKIQAVKNKYPKV